MLKNKHLIAGEWSGGTETFFNTPIQGEKASFPQGSIADINLACEAAEKSFLSYAATEREERAIFLEKIASEINSRGADITAVGTAETGLPVARLEGERARTCGQLRLFADLIRKGDYLDRRHDKALPDRTPLPRPDLKMMMQPIGPVAVFGASNFPLAFSTAGGDTAAALAAGCPVVIKGHAAHPGTSDIVSQAIDVARRACNLHPGIFSQIQSNGYAVGKALVQHPLIKAVGFTGSIKGGRILFDLCASRPEPIPFFGELGSINPMFLFPAAVTSRGASLAEGWAASLSMGAGQFCTNPGIVVLMKNKDSDVFISATCKALENTPSQTMLTDGIADTYQKGIERMKKINGVKHLSGKDCEERNATPQLFETSAEEWINNKTLHEEIFGPLGIVVHANNIEEMLRVAEAMEGQLTVTLHIDDADSESASTLMPTIMRKAGRILANGFPTGVEVCDAIVHGGPYPASTNFGATSVGTLSIRRFLRPVCYQNLPDTLLPKDIVS